MIKSKQPVATATGCFSILSKPAKVFEDKTPIWHNFTRVNGSWDFQKLSTNYLTVAGQFAMPFGVAFGDVEDVKATGDGEG